MRRVHMLLAAGLLAFTPHLAAAGEWISPPERVSLVELYTSEGCSSCPPADRWLSRLAEHPDLWHRVVPLGFHVDYWDYLGWHDRFASSDFSKRQRQHKRLDNVDGVYTPGFVINGREWRGFFTRRDEVPEESATPGVLAVQFDGSDCTIRFEPADAPAGPWVANLAWLGFDLVDEISRGENRGRKLIHDFVVLTHQETGPAEGIWRIASKVPSEANAIAVWISDPATLAPVQATGGWLKKQGSE